MGRTMSVRGTSTETGTDRGRAAHTSAARARTLRSGDALVGFDADLTIVSWNRAAEELTGISREEAVGRRCWEVLRGRDGSGNVVCHAGCTIGRLAREGWPVRCQDLLFKVPDGTQRVEMSTVVLDDADRRLFLHVLVPHRATAPGRSTRVSITPRQRQVLALLADGVPAKVIANRLGLAEATVRNHIRAILVALDTHSQLEAIAKARRLELVA